VTRFIRSTARSVHSAARLSAGPKAGERSAPRCRRTGQDGCHSVYNATLQKTRALGREPRAVDRLDEEFDRTGKIRNNLIVTSPISGIVVKKNISQGDYIQVGAEPYTVADLSRLWLQLKLL